MINDKSGETIQKSKYVSVKQKKSFAHFKDLKFNHKFDFDKAKQRAKSSNNIRTGKIKFKEVRAPVQIPDKAALWPILKLTPL